MSQFLFVLLSTLAACLNIGASKSDQKNVILLMFDDIGRSDLSMFTSEWETPNLDAFFSDSLMLSHHYIGYLCSASRSEFLTGRHSWHNGYGTLDTFGTIGSSPKSTPTLAEYLKKYANYNTYAVGKWQLGSATNDQLAYNRGFDYFLGFNLGFEEYISKAADRAPDVDAFVDFYENDQVNRDYSDGYSTDQYFDKMIDIIGNIANEQDSASSGDNTKPFFMYSAIQTPHNPFADSTQYYQECLEKFPNLNDDETMIYRLSVCEAMISADLQFGKLMDFFGSSDKLKEIYENTIIIITSDNGGDVEMGSACNYPLRGGKGTYFDGNLRVLTAVGGGALPNSQRGGILDGLISSVDWFPTILSFAGLIDKDASYVSFEKFSASISGEITSNSNAAYDTSLNLDGYNMYNYIMGIDDSSVRDHIVFHITPRLDTNQNLLKSMQNYKYDDFSEFAMVFYDDDGKLWKYFDFSSTVEDGDLGPNTGWCTVDHKYEEDETTRLVMFLTSVGLFDLTDDAREQTNMLNNDADEEIPSHLKDIIEEKIEFYTNVNLNRDALYGYFDCMTDDYTSVYNDFLEAAEASEAWVPFLTNSEWSQVLIDNCGFDTNHPMFKFLTQDVELPQSLFNKETGMVTAYHKDEVAVYQKRAPNAEKLPKRFFEDANSLDPVVTNTNLMHATGQIKSQSTSSLVNKFGFLVSGPVMFVFVAVFVLAACVFAGRLGLRGSGKKIQTSECNEYSPLTN